MKIELKLPVEVARDYSSPAQRIRVMTEEWDLTPPSPKGEGAVTQDTISRKSLNESKQKHWAEQVQCFYFASWIGLQ
jgi:hypothetical protein